MRRSGTDASGIRCSLRPIGVRTAQLEIDAAATEFPIAKTRRLRTFASADLGRSLGWRSGEDRRFTGGVEGKDSSGVDITDESLPEKRGTFNGSHSAVDIAAAAPISYIMTIASASAGRLAHLGILRFSGADALSFLQGQVSNDTQRLTERTPVLAAYSSAQGRVLALIYLLPHSSGVVAILPREILRRNLGTHAQIYFARKSAHRRRRGVVWWWRVISAQPPPARPATSNKTASARRRSATMRIVTGSSVRRQDDARLRRMQPRTKRIEACMAARRHSRRPAADLCGDQRSVCRADAESRPAGRDQLHQGLLHRAGNHRAHPALGQDQTQTVSVAVAVRAPGTSGRRCIWPMAVRDG